MLRSNAHCVARFAHIQQLTSTLILAYKDNKFHNAKPPATTGVTNLNLFQFAHFLAIASASPNSFSPALSANASNLSFSGCIFSAECKIVVKCMIAATPNSFQSLRASTPSRNTE